MAGIEERRREKARAYWMSLFDKGMSISVISRKCGVPRSTVYRWVNRYTVLGKSGLKSHSRAPKNSGTIKVTQGIEKQVLDLRAKFNWGSQSIHTWFRRNGGPEISTTTIWRILQKNKVKPVKKRRRKNEYTRYSRPVPGDRVQVDVTKVRPSCYQYTAIDDCTRLKVIRLFKVNCATNSVLFLHVMIDSFGDFGFAIQRVQTDCGKEFYNDAFQDELREHHIKYRPIPPASPHLNGKVERCQKTDKHEFYATLDLKDRSIDLDHKLMNWQDFYNYQRPHSSLSGKTPHEMLLEVLPKTPSPWKVFGDYLQNPEPNKYLELEKYKKRNPIAAKYLESQMSHMC